MALLRRRRRSLSPARLALILRYCEPLYDVWRPSGEWITSTVGRGSVMVERYRKRLPDGLPNVGSGPA